MQKLCNNLTAIGLHVSRLSHQLHSSELEYLGLAVAITKLCREFSEQYAIKVACVSTSIPAKLDNEIALAFFRIAQESLHNIARHSGASEVHADVQKPLYRSALGRWRNYQKYLEPHMPLLDRFLKTFNYD